MEFVKNYTIVLSNKALQHLGQLTGLKSIKYKANLNSPNEISFVAYKAELEPSTTISDKDILAYQDYIWNNLVDFKTIWVKELDEYFQIRVSMDDANDTVKNISGTSLCESELSQTNLYKLEINSETDLAISDYKPTTFYNAEDESASLLHRVLSKVPHYKIKHVDKSLCGLQRTFSVDGTSIYDFLTGECSEQFDCLFVFDTVSEDENTTSYRYVSVYDLMTVCDDCGNRGDFTDVCPKCGHTNLSYFGKDTTIYVDKNNLTDSIHFEMDGDSVKNCFKLEAGDDVMTAAVRSLNPNGTDYLYAFREDDKKDMPQELIAKLEEYSTRYESSSPLFKDLTAQEYDLQDKLLYYESSMIPSMIAIAEAPTISNIETPKEGVIYMHGNMAYLFDGTDFVPQHEDTDFLLKLAPLYETTSASKEAAKLTTDVLSTIALQTLHEQTHIETVNAALKNYAKLFIKTGYAKLNIDESTAQFVVNADENGRYSGTWRGQFVVSSYSDSNDVAYTGQMSIRVTDNYADFIKQKALKALGPDTEDNDSVFDVLSIENMNHFEKALTLYSQSRLQSFYDALEAALSVLQSKNQANKDFSELFDSLYVPYEQKSKLCSKQLSIIQSKISDVKEQLAILGLQKESLQSQLNLETLLGDLYPIFCSYKREDKYSNSNYISDGLNNAQLIERATEFWELAQKEIQKSANGEYSISSTLYNFLAMEEFQPLKEHFALGNWIRIRVDSQLYRLRMTGYEMDCDNPQTLNVTFSTVTKIPNLKAERKSILESAKSLATNFGYVSKQAEKGNKANSNMNSIVQNGLDSGLIQIKNNVQEEVTYGKQGLLLREYDDILDDYSGKQCKLTHNAMVYTTDYWKTASQAIGEHAYTYYDESTNGLATNIGYGITAQFCQSAYIYGGQILGADIYSVDYDKNNGVGSHISLTGRGSFKFGKVLAFDGSDLTIDGNGTFTGTINAKAGYIGSDEYTHRWTIGNNSERAYIYNGTDSMSDTTPGTYIGTDGIRNYQSSLAYVNISSGVLECNGASITGTITGSKIEGGEISINNNFHVTEAGNLTANNATLNNVTATSGSFKGIVTADDITANRGTIAGWNISSDSISSGTTVLKSGYPDGKIITSNIEINGGSFSIKDTGILDGISKTGWLSIGRGTVHPVVSGLNLDTQGGLNFRTDTSESSSGVATGGSINYNTSPSRKGLEYASGEGAHRFYGGAIRSTYAVFAGTGISSGYIMKFGANETSGIFIGKVGGDNGSEKDVTLISAGGNASLEVVDKPECYIRVSNEGNPIIRGKNTYLRTNSLRIHDGTDYNYIGFTGTKTIGGTTLRFVNGILVNPA